MMIHQHFPHQLMVIQVGFPLFSDSSVGLKGQFSKDDRRVKKTLRPCCFLFDINPDCFLGSRPFLVLHLQFKTGINESLFEHEKRPLTQLAEELLQPIHIFVLCSSSPIFFLPTWHIATLRSAGRLSAGVETFHQLVVVTELHSVCLVPSTPWEDAGSRTLTPVVGHDVGTALIGIQGSIHAAPIANGEDVDLLNAVHHSGGPMLAFVS